MFQNLLIFALCKFCWCNPTVTVTSAPAATTTTTNSSGQYCYNTATNQSLDYASYTPYPSFKDLPGQLTLQGHY